MHLQIVKAQLLLHSYKCQTHTRCHLQDQKGCAACVGFAVTAAAEAAVNVYKQQSWDKLSLSEQDFSFCRCDCRGSGLNIRLQRYRAASLHHLCGVANTCISCLCSLPNGRTMHAHSNDFCMPYISSKATASKATGSSQQAALQAFLNRT